MKDKTTAGILALLGGWLGLHRFYLGQPVLGVIYVLLLFTGISVLLGLIDGLAFLGMDQRKFDYKYNRQGRYPQRRPQRRPSSAPQRRPQKRRSSAAKKTRRFNKKNPFYETGLTKYEDFDMKGAIVDFKKALDINPHDPRVHYKLACAYSLEENVDKSKYHISKAVENGMKDVSKIEKEDSLAFLRIQEEFEEFKANGYKLNPSIENTEKTENLDEDILLRQLNKLKDLRKKGILTEKEFLQEKQKLGR